MRLSWLRGPPHKGKHVTPSRWMFHHAEVPWAVEEVIAARIGIRESTFKIRRKGLDYRISLNQTLRGRDLIIGNTRTQKYGEKRHGLH